MDINVHQAEKVEFRFHSLDEDHAFAVLKIMDKDGGTIQLFVRNDGADFLVELIEATETVLGVLVHGVRYDKIDEEE